MAYITIRTNNVDEDSFTLYERVMPSDLESEFFCVHLVERLRWAVQDAHAASPAELDGPNDPGSADVRHTDAAQTAW